ncbi:hypothetical protein QTI33_14760 [Variovorax sp. J22P271]|uniref:hypothetical protein n=1 Tax=Variovorax davisae TaxID=3053515 RepID=UPI0025792307|nr:hypothetical protein [Variovorax sp. J22P271]MDM0033394.1 hypothetical protein [Variovorax sp. J22P271]
MDYRCRQKKQEEPNVSRRIESVQDLAQLPPEELLPCLRALRDAIGEARRKRAEDRREGRVAADAPFSFPAFDWYPRGSRGGELPARVDPSTPIEEIPMRTGARAALNSLGIFYLEDLSAITERELMVKESIGRHTAERLREVLLRVGLDFLPNRS